MRFAPLCRAMLPPRAILVAIDFSDASRAAVRFAARLAVECHARLHALHVEDETVVTAAAARGMNVIREAREELRCLVDAAAGSPPPDVALHVVVGTVSDAIIAIGEREQVDLIVLSTHGWAHATPGMISPVTQRVLLDAQRSVIVLPDGWTAGGGDGRLGPVVVGIDDSEPSARAVTAGGSLAAALGTGIEVVHVVADSPVAPRWRHLADDIRTVRIEAVRTELGGRLTVMTPSLPSLCVESGDVAERLADAIVPSPGRHPILLVGRASARAGGSVPGSIAARVASLARGPVLMYVEPSE
jgi:nucleotide-binding universal stress UspA family protein